MNFFNALSTTQKSLVVAIVAIILYVASAGVAYSLFSGRGVSSGGGGGLTTALPGPGQVASEEDDPKVPHTEECPLNGQMKTKKSKDAWTGKRPLAVMIENHTEARPQSGLSSADVVYETVAEGGITRFMALFYCNQTDIQVGPVRSARTYFLDWLSEYDGLYAHVGGANTPGPANALGQIEDYGIKDLNQFSIGFPTFWRDYERLGHAVATEHTMYSTTQKLWEVGAKRGWSAVDSETNKRWDTNFVSWKFKDDSPTTGVGAVAKINAVFWASQTDYTVDWTYDSVCNCYKRKNGGVDHIDFDTKQQLRPKNVVVQFMAESPANDGYEGNAHRLYADKGQGKAIIFQDGKAIVGKWMKANRLAREKFVDGAGKEISFVRGQIWIETIPDGSPVTY